MADQMATSWDAVLLEARQMARQGQARDGVALLRSYVSATPVAWRLMPILHIASLNGLWSEVADLAAAYVEDPFYAGFRNMACTAWVLDILRKSEQYDAFFRLIAALPADKMGLPLIYKMVAEALHDDAMLTACEGRKEIRDLFKISLEQEQCLADSLRSEFVFYNVSTSITDPQATNARFQRHQAIFDEIREDLTMTRHAWMGFFLFGAREMLDVDGAIAALNSAAITDIYGVLQGDPERQAALLTLLRKDGGYAYCAERLNEQVILIFDKLAFCDTGSDFEVIVQNWLDRFMARVETQGFDAERFEALDPLVASRRNTHPALYERYRAHRKTLIAFDTIGCIQDIALRAPVVFGDRKPKVAVCISGQLRGYTQAFPQVKEMLLADVEPVFFVDTWKKIGRKDPLPAHAWRMFSGYFLQEYQSVCNTIGYDAVRARFRHLTHLDDANNVDQAQLAEFFGCDPEHVRVEDDEAEPFRGFHNPKKMHYKIQGAHRMALASGQDFDAMMRIRPDKGVSRRAENFDWKHLISKSRSERVFFADSPLKTHLFLTLIMGDQVGVASPEIMDLYANSGDLTVQAAKLGWMDWPDNYRAHTNFAHALWMNRVQVETMPVTWGPMYDPARLSPQEIWGFLERDLADRSPDSNDERLLAAARSDLAS